MNKVMINYPLFHDPVEITQALVAVASQENCDGPEYDLMMQAAEYIRALEAERLMINEYDLMQNVEDMVSKYGYQKAVAEKLGISTSYLNDYLSGRRDAGAKLLSALELRRVVFYESTFTEKAKSEIQ